MSRRPLSTHIRRNVGWVADALEKEGFDLRARIQTVDPSSIKAWEEPDSSKVEEIAETIRHAGARGEEWPEGMPLVVVGDGDLLIDGHHRRQAAIEAGLKTIPVIAIDDEAFMRATMIFGDAPFEVFALRSDLVDENENLRWKSGEFD